MEKRTLLAVVLSAAIWIAWFIIFKPEPQVVDNKAVQKTQQEKTTQNTSDQGSAVNTPLASNKPVSITAPEIRGSETTTIVETEQYKAVFSNKGAVIKSMLLKEKDVQVVVPQNTFAARGMLDFALHFNDNEFMNGNVLDASYWNMTEQANNTIRFATRIILNGIPLEIQKTFIFTEKGDSFRLEYTLINKGRSDLTLPNNSIIVSPTDLLGPSLDFTNSYNTMKGICSLNEKYKNETKGSGFFSKAGIIKKEEGNVNWIGVASRYLLVIMIPEKFSGSSMMMDNRAETGFRTGMLVPVETMRPGGSVTKSYTVFLGEQNKKRLAAVDKKIEKAADISMLIEPIRYFVIWSLKNINKLFGNMGWSLVIFSILTKVVFMPLTKKSTDSMKKMQALTPKINEIKAKYKDKPDVMQKEMMNMYRENKVNPMGGCLPILLQMPFFFALYSALINSMDLWHAPFIFWIKDLSMPDTVATIAGFNVNILPVLMTISTFLQQKLTTVDTGQSQQQKMMMTIMPLVFIFIFWSMPSGLVLYWTLQNFFQVANQLIVNRFSKETA